MSHWTTLTEHKLRGDIIQHFKTAGDPTKCDCRERRALCGDTGLTLVKPTLSSKDLVFVLLHSIHSSNMRIGK